MVMPLLSFKRAFCSAAVVCAACVCRPLYADWRQSILDNPKLGVSIELESPFEHIPKSGMWPVAVVIRNHSGRSRSWTLIARSSISTAIWTNRWSYEFSRDLSVQAGRSERFDILVPIPPNTCSKSPSDHFFHCSSNVFLEVLGYGNGNASVSTNKIQDNLGFSPYTVFTSAVLPKEGALSDELKTRNLSFAGVQISQLGLLPRDWKAYSGVSSLWITHSDWTRISAEARSAIEDWLLSGGKMYVTGPRSFDAALPGLLTHRSSSSHVNYGLGRVVFYEAPSYEVAPSEMAAEIEAWSSKAPTYNLLTSEEMRANNLLLARIKDSTLAIGVILFVMFMYAIVVGPVNLLFLARKERRFRLYITTPLIAIGTSSVLVLFILFQDGVGGGGHRASLVYLSPDRPRAVIFQEQAIGTGLLLKRDFSLSPEILLAPLAAGGSSTSTYYDSNDGYFSDGLIWGDWFKSRSKQAQYLTAVMPSRVRLEILHGEKPAVQSSIPAQLQHVIYRDSKGVSWMAKDLGPGERKELIEVHDSFIEEIINDSLQGGGVSHHSILEQFSADTGLVIGIASGYSPEFIFDTLPNVEWQSQQVVFITHTRAPHSGQKSEGRES